MKTVWLTEYTKKNTVALTEGKACIIIGIRRSGRNSRKS